MSMGGRGTRGGGVRNPVADGRVTVPQEVSAAGFCLAWLRAACTLHRERQEGGSGSGGCWARPPPGGGGWEQHDGFGTGLRKVEALKP